jgi:PAS domain-containing protein/HPt (histidine-containing phosphotransfer) domain-containing protein
MKQRQVFEKKPICTACIMLALFLLLVGVVLGANRFLEYGRTEAREEERLFTQASVIDKNLAWNLNSVNQVLTTLQSDPSWMSNERGILQRLNLLADAMPGIRTINFMDAGGTIRVSNRRELIGRNFKDREYFKTPQLHPDPDTLFVSPPFKTSLGVFALILSRVITGPDGEFAGMITATLDPQYFATLLSSVLYVPDMRSAIAHGDGTVFLSIPEGHTVLGTNLAVPGSFFSRHRAGGRKSSAFDGTAYIYGEKRLLVWHTVRPDGLKMDKPLMVTVSRDLGAVYQLWRFETLVRLGLYLLLIIASVLGLYSYRLRQRTFQRQAMDAAAALKESNERLELATSAACIGVWELDLASNRVTWNDAMYGIFGIPKGAPVTHQLFFSHVYPDDLAALQAGMAAALRHGGTLDDEFRIVRRDRAVRVLRAKAQVCRENGEQPARVVGVSFDITDSKVALLEAVARARRGGELESSNSPMTANALEVEAGLNAHLGEPMQVETAVETLGQCCVLNDAGQAPQPAAEEDEVILDAWELEGLPALDLADTLKRLNGNRLLYGQIARMTCARYAEVGQQVEQLWRGGERAAAGHLLHTFKGVALNMGALELGEVAGLLEKGAAREGAGDEERRLLARFQELLPQALASLRLVAERYQQPAARAGDPAGPVPGAAALEQLQQLMALLEESNMEAVDRFASFKERFGAALPADRLLWIGEAIEELDFAAALEYCSVLTAVLEAK